MKPNKRKNIQIDIILKSETLPIESRTPERPAKLKFKQKRQTDFNFQCCVRKFKVRFVELQFQATNGSVAKSKQERPTNPKTENYS